MANALFESGREGFLDGSIDWDTDTINAIQLDLHTADVGIKAITGATNATPIVITATGHGYANGDVVLIDGVLGNLAANGLWKIKNQATNTFELTRLDDTNVVGSAAYTSGGYAVNLGSSVAGNMLDDFSAARVGTDVTLTSPTKTAGVADAADPTFTAVTGATIEALALYKSSGGETASRMIAILTGKHIVTIARDVAATDTTVWVEALAAGIPTSTVITFSNGVALTLNGAASAGARSITVTSAPATIVAGHVGMAPATGSGLPVTPNSGNITYQFAALGIFKL